VTSIVDGQVGGIAVARLFHLIEPEHRKVDVELIARAFAAADID
jgi:hypothetical protein